VSFQQFRDIYRNAMKRLSDEIAATDVAINRTNQAIMNLNADEAVAKQHYWVTPEGQTVAVAKKKLKVILHSAEVYPERDTCESVVISLRVNSSVEAKTVQTRPGTSEQWNK
jgi:hypothetical protein